MKTCALLFCLGMMERRLDSTTTSCAVQTELLVPFQASRTVATEDEQPELLIPFVTFHTAAVKEAQTELIIPFWIIRAAEKEEEQTELFIPFWTIHTAKTSLQGWIVAHEYSLERS